MIFYFTKTDILRINTSPSYNHVAIKSTIITEINSTQKFRAFSELTLLIDDNDYTPNISVYKRHLLNYYANEDVPKMEEMPLLAIEVLSPDQKIANLMSEAKCYLQAGIKSVWIVRPFAHTISVFTKNGTKLYRDGLIENSSGVRIELGVIFED